MLPPRRSRSDVELRSGGDGSGGDVVELLNNLLGRRQPVRLLEIIQQFNNVPVLFDGD
jgi:hypothetical protein